MKKKFEAVFDGRNMDSADILAEIFANRGIDDIGDFLNPTADSLIPLDRLHNIKKAFDLLDNALDNEDEILVYADTDTDGCTSASIMYRYIKNFTDNIKVYINKGKAHGVEDYDFTKESAGLVIIVDSINSPDVYNAIGKPTIVLDHHILLGTAEEYNGVALVSSANDYPNPELSGAGVTWKFCKYCDDMYFTDYADNLADLAATGIVADMCSMASPENRYICDLGLSNLKNVGISKVNGTYRFDAQAISFGIAPLVNACNRLNENELALSLFMNDDEAQTKETVKQLRAFKDEQNEIVASIIPTLTKQYEAQAQDNILIFTYEVEDDISISGLLGNKLSGIYQRPCIVLKHTDEGYAGSARGYGTENFKQMIDSTGLAWTGGHENACGIKIKDEDYDRFVSAIKALCADYQLSVNNSADVEIDIEQISDDMINRFKQVNIISGDGFEPIKVLIKGITDYEVGDMSKGKHLKLTVGGITIIKWNYTGGFDEFDGRPVTVIGTLDMSYFGRTLYRQVIIEDYKIGE